jgi:hypothetical protein
MCPLFFFLFFLPLKNGQNFFFRGWGGGKESLCYVSAMLSSLNFYLNSVILLFFFPEWSYNYSSVWGAGMRVVGVGGGWIEKNIVGDIGEATSI